MRHENDCPSSTKFWQPVGNPAVAHKCFQPPNLRDCDLSKVTWECALDSSNSRKHGHPWNAATLAVCRAVITTSCSPGGMLQLFMWFYDVAECHINGFQLHGEECELRVLDRFICSEIWNRCIKLQKWCVSVLCGPSAVLSIFGESVRHHTVHVQFIRTTDENNWTNVTLLFLSTWWSNTVGWINALFYDWP